MESGTLEQTLPGLEGVTPQPELEIGRAIAINPQKRLMLFSGRSNPDLAQRIAEQLGIELGRVNLKTFANGETYCRYEESVRGADMFIVQSACDPVDRHLMELLIMINAARLASAKRITAVVPWYFYARRSPPVSWRTCCSPPEPTACSRWTSTQDRCRGSSTSPSTT